MMPKIMRLCSYIGVIAITSFFMKGVEKTKNDTQISTSDKYEIQALQLPENLDLAGERVPIERQHIRERMDRELLVNTYWQSNGLLLLKRANKYFPILEPLLKKYGLPDDFKYLAVAESALIDETSSAGAAGMWHFMRNTGKEYGLEINRNVDERYHIEKSTKVAAQYLIKAKEDLDHGPWLQLHTTQGIMVFHED